MQRNKSRKVTETTVKLNAFGINDSFLQDVLENFEKSLNQAKFYLQYAAIIRMFGIVVLEHIQCVSVVVGGYLILPMCRIGNFNQELNMIERCNHFNNLFSDTVLFQSCKITNIRRLIQEFYLFWGSMFEWTRRQRWATCSTCCWMSGT